jgi:hypothetical protein
MSMLNKPSLFLRSIISSFVGRDSCHEKTSRNGRPGPCSSTEVRRHWAHAPGLQRDIRPPSHRRSQFNLLLVRMLPTNFGTDEAPYWAERCLIIVSETRLGPPKCESEHPPCARRPVRHRAPFRPACRAVGGAGLAFPRRTRGHWSMLPRFALVLSTLSESEFYFLSVSLKTRCAGVLLSVPLGTAKPTFLPAGPGRHVTVRVTSVPLWSWPRPHETLGKLTADATTPSDSPCSPVWLLHTWGCRFSWVGPVAHYPKRKNCAIIVLDRPKKLWVNLDRPSGSLGNPVVTIARFDDG